MKVSKVSLLIAVIALKTGFVHSQGTFRNLDFESAAIPPSTPAGSFIPISAALPGWIAYLGENQQSQVLYNAVSTGTAIISLIGPDTTGHGVIDGYSVVLEAGANPITGPGSVVSAAIAQTSLVPIAAKSLFFAAFWRNPDLSGFEVTLSGHKIPLIVTSGGQGLTEFGGDISAFAGQTIELRFEVEASSPPFNGIELDSITFSNQAVPEPNALGLLLFGAVLFGFRQWWGSSNPLVTR